MILIIDNYDSFTHNLFQYFKEITDQEVRVVRNDKITVEEVEQLNPAYLVISPGPGRPEEAGISEELILRFMGRIPILGVCLGHQAIGHALGGRIIQASRIVHGKAEDISVDGKGIFRSIPSPTKFTRYHSLAVDEESLPDELEVSARSADGQIMGLRHKSYILEGVQFHPESIASEEGKKLLRNFLNYRREPFDAAASLQKLVDSENLPLEDAGKFMEELTDGNLSDMQIAAFLTALAAKGPAPEEIAGCARVLQRKRQAVKSRDDVPCVDTCGTGGDGLHTFNISSLAALLIAGAGVRVAKHGNRAVSSTTGSADFYSALGIEIRLSVKEAEEMLNRNDFSFLFAPTFHAAMRFAAPARRALKIKTIMNLMGPLVNPALAEYQLIGVYDRNLCRPMAEALQILGTRRALLVAGLDGQDEISVSGPSHMVLVDREKGISEFVFNPEEEGLAIYPLEYLKGGDGVMNAKIARIILGLDGLDSGQEHAISHEQIEALRAAVLLNAGAALWVAEKADSIMGGYALARESLETGSAGRKLLASIQMSQALFGTDGRL